MDSVLALTRLADAEEIGAWRDRRLRLVVGTVASGPPSTPGAEVDAPRRCGTPGVRAEPNSRTGGTLRSGHAKADHQKVPQRRPIGNRRTHAGRSIRRALRLGAFVAQDHDPPHVTKCGVRFQFARGGGEGRQSIDKLSQALAARVLAAHSRGAGDCRPIDIVSRGAGAMAS